MRPSSLLAVTFWALALPGFSAAQTRRGPATATRWLAPIPYSSGSDTLALAVVGPDGTIRDCATNRCADQARVGQLWRAVDAWGQALVEESVVARERYDTAPRTSFQLGGTPRPGALWVRGAWTPAPSFRWLPAATVRDAGLRFARELTSLVAFEPTAAAPTPQQLEAHVRFAQGHGANAQAWLTVDGPVFAIARRNAAGAFALEHILLPERFNGADREQYTVLAILDLDGDGSPEVVYQTSVAESYSVDALRFDGHAWVRVARTGGSTI